ncbi:unnamed protein product [Prunus armeniaca]|uniref:Uncharacterized protein n=1 Tax=Prunus armeniaca TaxID=36596 RepID=A0A6J5V5Z6_PRUAR|nr:unnamed protein product [Prunus armeniaca]CAB4313946.1 unnamed protein product [Prunus armeniaca]
MAGDISQTLPTVAPALSRPPDSLCKGSKQHGFRVGNSQSQRSLKKSKDKTKSGVVYKEGRWCSYYI